MQKCYGWRDAVCERIKKMTKQEAIVKLLEEAADTEMPEFARIWIDKTVSALNTGGGDRLAELEAAVLEHYLKKGYKLEKDQSDCDIKWSFDVVIGSEHKSKILRVGFHAGAGFESVYRVQKETTREMFDAAIEHFRE